MELEGEGASLGAVGGISPNQVKEGSDHEDEVSQANPSPSNGSGL